MKKLFSIFAILSLAVGFTACEESTTPEEPAKEYTVALSANKSEILADGAQSVSFEITVDGVGYNVKLNKNGNRKVTIEV